MAKLNPNQEEIIKLMNQTRDKDGAVDPRKAADNLRDAGYGRLADQTAKRG